MSDTDGAYRMNVIRLLPWHFTIVVIHWLYFNNKNKYLQKYGGETSQEMCTLNITDMRNGEKLMRIVSSDR